MGNSGYRNRYRNLRPGDYGTCVLNYGVQKKQVFAEADYFHYTEVGVVTSHKTRVLVVAVTYLGYAAQVQVVLPDGAVGWLRLGTRDAYAGAPGKLVGHDLHIVSPKLKINPNRTVTWRTIGDSQTD
jgi:hypothetical protein